MKAAFKPLRNYPGIVLRGFLALLLVCPATPLLSDEQTAVTSTRDATVNQATQHHRTELEHRAEDLDTPSGSHNAAISQPQPGSPSHYRSDRLDGGRRHLEYAEWSTGVGDAGR
jgi:hypothetical protein